MKTIDSDIMEIISDMYNFVVLNWDLYKIYMEVQGFTEEDIKNMEKGLFNFLEEEGYR